ncbi:hypothetical protein JCM13580A_35720 [Streptomyces drozdowiczii]
MALGAFPYRTVTFSGGVYAPLRRPDLVPWQRGAATFPFAGHRDMPWPKLLSTVTAVRFRINPRARSGHPRGAPEIAPCVTGRPLWFWWTVPIPTG